jgi:rubrerythrin
MPEGEGMERLRSSKTIGEILETAKSFEKSARDFYAGLEGKVSKPIRELVHELAQEETRHYALFDELSKREDVHARIADVIATPANDHKFSDYVHLPDLGEHPDDQSILQYAMGREHAAMEHYAALAEEMPEGAIRDLFSYLSQEELTHKAELEKKYYALVYTTNV